MTDRQSKTKTVVIVLVTLAAPLLLILLSLTGCQTTPPEPVRLVAQPVQLRCAPATDVILFLKRKFNEDPVYTGIYENQIILTVFVSPSKSFTVVHTGIANEISCLVSSGQNFKKLDWEEKKSV
jgi:hypothetical protein|tara:strand:- start:144 stop:515 length:372 start_codon:yes stop_codon:yes gene_type:complete